MAWGKKTKEVREAIEDDGDEETEERNEDDSDEETQIERRHSNENRRQENRTVNPSQPKQISKEEVDDMINGTLSRLAQLIEIRKRL